MQEENNKKKRNEKQLKVMTSRKHAARIEFKNHIHSSHSTSHSDFLSTLMAQKDFSKKKNQLN